MRYTRIFCLAVIFSVSAQDIPAQDTVQLNERLSVISYLSVSENFQFVPLPEDSVLRKYLKVEVITENVFLQMQKKKIDLIQADTSGIRKKNGIIKLPLLKGVKQLKDKAVDDESRVEHTYLGQIAFLNAYLIRTMYWEDMSYGLFNKTNGTELASFSSIPHISPDKKKIATAYADPYETEAEIAIYTITGMKIKNKVLARFKNWMPGDEAMIFWGADGKLYLPIQFTETYWKENGDLNTDYRYIRVSLL